MKFLIVALLSALFAAQVIFADPSKPITGNFKGKLGEIEIDGVLQKVLFDVDGTVAALLGDNGATLEDVAKLDLNSALKDAENFAGKLVKTGKGSLELVDSATGNSLQVSDLSENLLNSVKGLLSGIV